MRLTDKMITVFGELVRCGIWGTDPNILLFDELNSAEWDTLFRMVGKHAVTGITFPIIEKLPATLRPQRKIYLEWCGMALHIKNTNQRMREVYEELIGWFEQAGVYPILMKGIGVADWYPQPMLRIAGDIDLYVERSSYQTAVALIKQAGICLKQTPEHDEFIFQGIQIELHTDTSHYGTIFEKQNMTDVMSGERVTYHIPSVEANALLLIQHPAKHMFTSGSAIRHLCDWAVFLQRNYDRIVYDRIEVVFQHEKIELFAIVFTSLATNFLGLDKTVVPQSWLDKSRKKQEQVLLKDLLAKGDCGIHYCHERHAMGNLSFSWNACKSWISYYGSTYIRLCRLSILFPGVIHKMIMERIVCRMKMLIKGSPFASC